jgi:hypothetical protein
MFACCEANVVISKAGIRRIDWVNWLAVAVSSDVLRPWISVRKLLVLVTLIGPARATKIAIPVKVQQARGIQSV